MREEETGVVAKEPRYPGYETIGTRIESEVSKQLSFNCRGNSRVKREVVCPLGWFK